MPTINGSYGGGIVGRTTATAATAFYVLVPGDPSLSALTVISKISETNGNTVNNLTLMRPLSTPTTASAAATTASNTITLTADPGNTGNGIAANDVVVTQNSDGTQNQYVAGAWNSTTKVLTVTASALASNVAAGGKVWFLGVNSDTDPRTGSAHPVIPGAAVNTTADVFVANSSGFRGYASGDPLVIYDPNATAQSVVNYVEYSRTRY